ncbi:MAG TPA: hypothetical protein VHW47_08435, partial [Acidimicrobiales bacterium]|nr:hypothetical protein [Acidimicrobiales bacterium]
MSTTSEEELEAVPGFAQVPVHDLAPELSPDDPSPLENEAPPTTSPPNLSGPPLPASAIPSTTTSSRTSTDPPAKAQKPLGDHLNDALADFGNNTFVIGAAIVNRGVQAKTKSQTKRWLATEAEAEAFGAAAARIAARHAPDELREEGDMADAAVMGTVAVSYLTRNLLSVGEPNEATVGVQMPATAAPLAQPAPPAAPPVHREPQVIPVAPQGPQPTTGYEVAEATPA